VQSHVHLGVFFRKSPKAAGRQRVSYLLHLAKCHLPKIWNTPTGYLPDYLYA